MRANLITLAAALLAIVVWVGFHIDETQWNGVKVAGAVVAGVSLVLLVVARLQLGGSFSVQAKAKRLVTKGLYARVRNPIYVFGALMLVGIAVVLGNWLLFGFVVLLTPVQIVRARKEEAVLAGAFGEEYARYKAGTWF